MHAFFFRFLNNGEYPLFSIGPHWPFTIGLIIFAIGVASYMGYLISKIYAHCVLGSILVSFLALVNIVMMFATILSDPGVPPQIYKRYSKFYQEQ